MHSLNDAAWFRGIYSFGRRVMSLSATRRLDLRSCSLEHVFEIADGQASEEGNAKRRFVRRNKKMARWCRITGTRGRLFLRTLSVPRVGSVRNLMTSPSYRRRAMCFAQEFRSGRAASASDELRVETH